MANPVFISQSTITPLKVASPVAGKCLIEFAFKNPTESLSFVRKHAQEMDSKVMQKHIDLYVNDYSLSLGEKGKSAVTKMYNFSVDNNLIRVCNKDLFFHK